MPLLFSTILNHYEEHQMGGAISSRDGKWSEAEKNVIRFVLQAVVQKAIDWLNASKQEELQKMPFVCSEDESCNRNWDLFNFSTEKQAIAVQNIKKFWSELRETQQ